MTYEADTTGASGRLITAYFEDRSAAVRAMERLVALGIPESQLRLTEGSGTATTTAATERHTGFWDALADLFLPDEDRSAYAEGLRRGGYVVSARVDDSVYTRAVDILDDDGTIDISEREQTWRSEGWTGTDYAGMSSASGRTTAADIAGASGSLGTAGDTGYTGTGQEERIPLAEERLRVGRREVDHGRVRVRSYVIEEPVREAVTLHEERVSVDRRPVDRAATAADGLFQERTIELDERGEEAVVSKDARVTEEVVLRKDQSERTEEIADSIRRTEVEVDDERGVRRDPLDRRA